MAFVDSADLGRPRRAQSVDALLMGNKWSRLHDLCQVIRKRMVFLDDQAALHLLGFSVAMASCLAGLSLGTAWLIVHFILA